MPQQTEDGDWVGLSSDELPVAGALELVRLPSCGAVTLFLGTVRDHSPGRPGVELVRYEAWEEQAERVLTDVAAEARRRHPTLGRVVLLHRTGALGVGEVSVVVATSAPHRAEAFDAGRFCIDTIKVTLPVWKLERWEGGEEFGLDAHPARPA